MTIIGCGFHPRYQQIAMIDKERGELADGKPFVGWAILNLQAPDSSRCSRDRRVCSSFYNE